MEKNVTLTDDQIVVEYLPLENFEGNARKNLSRTQTASNDDTDGTESDTGDGE